MRYCGIEQCGMYCLEIYRKREMWKSCNCIIFSCCSMIAAGGQQCRRQRVERSAGWVGKRRAVFAFDLQASSAASHRHSILATTWEEAESRADTCVMLQLGVLPLFCISAVTSPSSVACASRGQAGSGAVRTRPRAARRDGTSAAFGVKSALGTLCSLNSHSTTLIGS